MTAVSDARPSNGAGNDSLESAQERLTQVENELKLAKEAVTPHEEALAHQLSGHYSVTSDMTDRHRADRRTSWSAFKQAIVLLWLQVVQGFREHRLLKKEQRAEMRDLEARLARNLAPYKTALAEAESKRDQLTIKVQSLRVQVAGLEVQKQIDFDARQPRPTWRDSTGETQLIPHASRLYGSAGQISSPIEAPQLHEPTMEEVDDFFPQVLSPATVVPPYDPKYSEPPHRSAPSRRARTSSGGVLGSFRSRKVVVGCVSAAGLGVAAAVLLPNFTASKGSPSPKAAPLQVSNTDPSAAPTQDGSGPLTPTTVPSPTPTPTDPAQKYIDSDNAMPPWLATFPEANTVASRLQPYVLSIGQDSRIVTHSTTWVKVKNAAGKPEWTAEPNVSVDINQLAGRWANKDKTAWIGGQQRWLYLICLLTSGCDPTFKLGTTSGLVPMEDSVTSATAAEMGITVLPPGNSAEAIHNNLLIAGRRINDITAIQMQSKVMHRQIMDIEAKYLAIAATAKKVNYDVNTDPQVIAEESDLYIKTFIALWFNELDIANDPKTGASNLKVLKKVTAAEGLTTAWLRKLYLDWGLDIKTSTQANLIFKLPSFKSRFARANSVRVA